MGITARLQYGTLAQINCVAGAIPNSPVLESPSKEPNDSIVMKVMNAWLETNSSSY